MLEKPNLQDEQIIVCLHDVFGLTVAELTFLPLGADANTVVYRATTTNGTAYFVKLRRGTFDTINVDVPKFLHDQGIRQVIAPLAARSGDLSAPLDEFHVLLSPFVEGHNGWDQALSDDNWKVFGQALKAIHSASLPPALAARIPRETYSPRWREQVRQFQAQIETTTYADPSASALAALLKTKGTVVDHLIKRAEDLSAILLRQPSRDVLCHSDVHVGNLLINDHALYIVDWDQPILAPKERDLMFIGAGIGMQPSEREDALFYMGYGQTEIDYVALVYYRYERIVQDIAAYCEQLLLTDEGGEDRPNSLRQIVSQFQRGSVIEIAYRTERLLPREFQTPL